MTSPGETPDPSSNLGPETAPSPQKLPAASASGGLPLRVPPALEAVLAAIDGRETCLEAREVHGMIRSAVGDREKLPLEFRRGSWADQVAFAFSTHRVAGGGPWKTHFQPEWTFTAPDGAMRYSPDIAEIDAEVLAHWEVRAKAAKHPVLAARFADLVWDLTPVVTKAKRQPGAIEFARLAIDGYLAASRLDDGTAWGETRVNLGRALHLALSVKDSVRIADAVRAHLDYVNRTAEEERVGTFCYLFDNLLAGRKVLELEEAQEQAIISMFEATLAKLATPGGPRDMDPYSTEDVGMRLASYYERRGKSEERQRAMRVVAEAFERRARIGDALMRQHFLHEAYQRFLSAGLREDADRILLELEQVGPDAERRLVRTSVSHEVPAEELDAFLDDMLAGDRQDALRRFVSRFIPDQNELASRADALAKEFPLSAILGARPVKLSHGGRIEADVGDATGDPDGALVHRTAEALSFQVPWIAWSLERFVQRGLTAEQLLAFVERCPLFLPGRMDLIRRGVHAHLNGDYVQAVHLLIPQIEHAAVRLLQLSGRPATKPHRTGRGVLQSKNLNDVLTKDVWPVEGPGGENLRLYLLAALAHPKGLNIRNEVSHGLWSTDRFVQHASERVLHALLALSCLQLTEVGVGRDDPAVQTDQPGEMGPRGNAAPDSDAAG